MLTFWTNKGPLQLNLHVCYLTGYEIVLGMKMKGGMKPRRSLLESCQLLVEIEGETRKVSTGRKSGLGRRKA